MHSLAMSLNNLLAFFFYREKIEFGHQRVYFCENVAKANLRTS